MTPTYISRMSYYDLVDLFDEIDRRSILNGKEGDPEEILFRNTTPVPSYLFLKRIGKVSIKECVGSERIARVISEWLFRRKSEEKMFYENNQK
jgi:hypothetical protein